MSRIAKGSCCRASCSQKQALAQIAKSGGLRFRSELPAVFASGRAAGVGDANAGAFLPERGFVMRNRIDIDSKHSRAIVQEIGRDYARSCKKSRNPRRALERKSTGSANGKSHHHQTFQRLSVGTSVAIEPLWTAQTARLTWTSNAIGGAPRVKNFG